MTGRGMGKKAGMGKIDVLLLLVGIIGGYLGLGDRLSHLNANERGKTLCAQINM